MFTSILFIFVSVFAVTESSSKEYAIIEQLQKFNPQKCMQCPEFNLTQTCGFVDESMAVAFAYYGVLVEKKPVPCGKQYINYHTYWSKQTCAKAIIRCSTDQYKYAYVYGEKLFNNTLANNCPKINPMSFLMTHLQSSTFGTFICNQNGQWQHVDEEFWTPLMKRKRRPVKENISCFFSNHAWPVEDTSDFFIHC